MGNKKLKKKKKEKEKMRNQSLRIYLEFVILSQSFFKSW